MPTWDCTVQGHFQETCSSGSLPRQQRQIESDIIGEAFEKEDDSDKEDESSDDEFEPEFKKETTVKLNAF